jgi:hypothetical protein
MAKHALSALLVFGLFAAHAAFAAAPGNLTDEVALLVEKSIANGWAPEQVKLLAGPPEFTQQFAGGIEVWRYRTSKTYLLVAFQAGKVTSVQRRPIEREVSKATVEAALNQTAKVVETPYLTRIGEVFGLVLGETEPRVNQRLSEQGLRVSTSSQMRDDEIICLPNRNGRSCIIPPPLSKRWGLNKNPGEEELVILAFNKSSRLTTIAHVISGDDADAIRKSYAHYSEALSASFGGPSHKAFRDYGRLGAWVLRNTLMGPDSRITSSEGWSSGDIAADLALCASAKSPKSSLWIVHSLPKAGND